MKRSEFTSELQIIIQKKSIKIFLIAENRHNFTLSLSSSLVERIDHEDFCSFKLVSMSHSKLGFVLFNIGNM